MTSRTPCDRPCAGLCSESGFAAAFAAHRPRLMAKAMAVVTDRQHAEDAVQEAFLRAWSKCSTFDPDGPPVAAWLTTITRNVAIDQERARAARPRLVREQPPHTGGRPRPDGPTGNAYFYRFAAGSTAWGRRGNPRTVSA